MAEVVPRGKHLLMRLVGPAQERLTIHSHLKMEGSWQVYPPAAGGGNRFTARCVLRTAAADAVGFSLGILEVVRPPMRTRLWVTSARTCWARTGTPTRPNGGSRRGPDVPIGVALLDQRNLAGIGNIYRCEACFLAGCTPASPVSAVPGPGRDVMPTPSNCWRRTSGRAAGSPCSRPRDPVGRTAGRPGYWVYRREHQPCLSAVRPSAAGCWASPAAGTKNGTSTSARHASPSWRRLKTMTRRGN